MSREDNAMFYQAIGNSIQENKDKIEKLEKQNGRLKKKNKKLKEEIKGYQTMYFDKVMIINKAIEFIELNIRDIDYDTEEYDYLMELLKGDKD